jgi:hypothetical protein
MWCNYRYNSIVAIVHCGYANSPHLRKDRKFIIYQLTNIVLIQNTVWGNGSLQKCKIEKNASLQKKLQDRVALLGHRSKVNSYGDSNKTLVLKKDLQKNKRVDPDSPSHYFMVVIGLKDLGNVSPSSTENLVHPTRVFRHK